jgi:hypothetical protein
MLKEAHIISYIQQASHEWIEGDEEETTYTQTWKWFQLTSNMDVQSNRRVFGQSSV